jgi:hypothetical protein
MKRILTMCIPSCRWNAFGLCIPYCRWNAFGLCIHSCRWNTFGLCIPSCRWNAFGLCIPSCRWNAFGLCIHSCRWNAFGLCIPSCRWNAFRLCIPSCRWNTFGLCIPSSLVSQVVRFSEISRSERMDGTFESVLAFLSCFVSSFCFFIVCRSGRIHARTKVQHLPSEMALHGCVPYWILNVRCVQGVYWQYLSSVTSFCVSRHSLGLFLKTDRGCFHPYLPQFIYSRPSMQRCGCVTLGLDKHFGLSGDLTAELLKN